MEDDREGDIRVPLISFLFCLCLITGGIFLALYVFVPNLSEPWYPVAAFVLIGLPWVFWFLTYLYACMKGCFGGREGGAVDSRQISRRQTTRDVSNSASAMQNHGNQQSGGVNPSVASSRESEMPLTYSGLWKVETSLVYTPDGQAAGNAKGNAGWMEGPAAVDNDSMYVVDQENGSLSQHNADGDCWEELIEPSELLKGAEHLSVHKGKICAALQMVERSLWLIFWQNQLRLGGESSTRNGSYFSPYTTKDECSSILICNVRIQESKFSATIWQ